MNLYLTSIGFFAWLGQILRTFLSVRPWTTTVVITALAVAHVTRLLTFFLPLKVILLAGSDGVPRYFPFINPDEKLAWIIGLTIAAFVCYGVTLALNAVTDRLAQAGAEEVLQSANELTVLSGQEDVAQSYYARFCEVAANLFFISIGLILGLLLNPWPFLFMTGLLGLLILFTAWVLRGADDVNPSLMKRFVQDDLKDYMRILSSAIFLLGFLAILAPFVLGDGMNILIAILSVVILRQVLRAMVSAVNDSADLGKDRNKINALVFRDFQWHKLEKPVKRSMRELFHKDARQKKVREALGRVVSLSGPVDVRLKDSAIGDVSTFVISARDSKDGRAVKYLLQVFPPREIQRLENEEFLFKNITRERLKAPHVLIRFREGPFECQIYDYGTGETVAAARWRAWQLKLLEHYWSCQPPRSLVKAFAASHPLLHKRLSNELVQRLGVAVDTESEAEVLDAFKTYLPVIRRRIQSYPLYIHNADNNRNNVVSNGEGGVYVMTWGRWSMEPVGAVLPRAIKQEELKKIIGNVNGARDDISGALLVEDIVFVSKCWELEAAIEKGAYKSAMNLVEGIIKSPVNKDRDEDEPVIKVSVK